jgi:hypothetical protein
MGGYRLALVGVTMLWVAWQSSVPAVVAGTDAGSGIQYALVPLDGKQAGARDAVPRLTAQCTKTPAGKLKFELLMDAGDVSELRFIAPWRQTKESLFAPYTPKVTVTMEFVGYRKEKPVKRVWTTIDGLPGELKYATPGLASPNMEEIRFYLQYLRALPTLRATWTAPGGKSPVTTEFETSAWLQRVKTEPLCAASGL